MELVLIAGSLWRKILVTAVAVGGFVWLYEATILDSKDAVAGMEETALPAPGRRVAFMATAYCKGLISASGVAIQSGIAASDPALLPLGSIVELDANDSKYDGIYTILDTGPAVKGREVDLYMWSCHEALRFGRQQVRLQVLRLGWSPRAVTPTLLDRLLRRAEPPPPPLPSRPLPQSSP
jgi:3D (Asp-Asp-Asp) domain-containing protein